MTFSMPARLTWRATTFFMASLIGLDVSAGPPVEFPENGRVVFLGDALFERAQTYGHLEAALTSRLPQLGLTFRNLGWSGDNVFGRSRAGFGAPATGSSRWQPPDQPSAGFGYEQMLKQLDAVEPDIVFVGFGANDSHAGADGLDAFEKGLANLVQDLQDREAQVILVTPLKQEDLGAPLPKPDQQNANRALYAERIRELARERELPVVDVFETLRAESSNTPLTHNGIHLTDRGYQAAAKVFLKGLGLAGPAWQVSLEGGEAVESSGAMISNIQRNEREVAFNVRSNHLPLGNHDTPAREERWLSVKDLPPGQFALTIDGAEVATGTAEDWAQGVAITRGPDFEQAETLRATIVKKNRLYFYRWRPQNNTYLFLFRKHEQGQNAAEIPRFDPLVEAEEAVIAELAQPETHRYVLKRRADE